MSRRTLTDEQWARIEPLVPGRASSPGRTAADTRLFIDAVLWLARGATPWRDLPPELGKWSTTHCRFRRWSLSGVWERLFKALAEEPDFEYVLIDATISKAHADAAYDADHLRAFIRDDLGASAQIPSNPSRTFKRPLDRELYKERHLVECFFNKIKRFRRIALRCEKTIASFTAFIHLACTIVWLT